MPPKRSKSFCNATSFRKGVESSNRHDGRAVSKLDEPRMLTRPKQSLSDAQVKSGHVVDAALRPLSASQSNTPQSTDVVPFLYSL